MERVDPAGIPEFTGNLAMLAADCMGFDAAATRIRSIGSDVHDEFQGLSSFYTAPEAEQLFATTAPARDRAAGFADDLATVRSALWDYHEEITPLVSRLRRLRYEAEQFVESIRDDDDWKKSESKVNRNNELLTEVSTTVAQFWAAERSCANRINALWGGPQWTTDDGSGGAHMYGVGEEEMAQAGETPWGRAVEREYHWYRFDQHIKSFVWDGLIVDGIWGTITGLGGLLGFQGWEVFKESWKGLGQLATGLAIVASPLNALAYSLMPDGAVKDWMDDSLDVTLETAKGLVAWDTWSEDPARAAGLTTFNVLTTVASFGAGAGVRAAASGAGTATRITATAARVGTAIDPMTYLTSGLTTLTRFSEISSQLAHLTTARAFELPDGSFRLDNGSVIPPNGPFNPEILAPGQHAVGRPDGSILWDDGTILHPDGRLESPTGHPLRTADDIPAELSSRDRSLLDTAAREPTGVGGPRPQTDLTSAHSSPHSADAHVPSDSRSEPPWNRSGGSDDPQASVEGPHDSTSDPPGGPQSSHGGGANDGGTLEGPSHDDIPLRDHDQSGWSGAGWVEKPTESAARAYEEIRGTPNKVDLPAISNNTGIDEAVLRQVKSHLFRSQHDIAIGPGETRRGPFTPRDDIAEMWNAARDGNISPAQLREFKFLMAHEYVESRLMEAGMPYISHNPAAGWAEDGKRIPFHDPTLIGAHEVAPNPANGNFRSWERLFGEEHGRMEIATDLSNVDAIVKTAKTLLNLRGWNLK
ncbi:hypothetical protein ACFV5N_17520 [Streptomyces sp. NPDC059853]|uniref:hypothetical protein n=1 Tax=Streptomyces sp. NPDC059853 TaxID=3346973 RepID=UPI0036474E3C